MLKKKSLSILENSKGEVVVPRHLAIIMDGNGRWAQKRGLIRLMGHKQGAKAVTKTVEAAAKSGISILTLFAFSSENWKRPEAEVNGLMDLFAKVLKSERQRIHENQIKVRFVGDISRFSEKLKKEIVAFEELTKDNQCMVLNIAINYGGRWDITQATKRIATQVAQGQIKVEDIDEQVLAQNLQITEEVDLLIRTGGESRISNFLLYQCAYSEILILDSLWPDFNEETLEQAIAYFNRRERRFGMISEQVRATK